MIVVNSKALLNISDSKKVETLCNSLDQELIPISEKIDTAVFAVYSLQKEKEILRQNYWNRIKKVLLDQGYIDQLDVSLSLRSGVTYLDYLSENVEFVRKSLKDLFDDTLV
jgi:hypothetical protein